MVKINREVPAFKDYDVAMFVNGQTFNVRKSMSRMEKEVAAAEMISKGMFFDEEYGICYNAINRDVTDFFVVVKYYTDINVEPYDDEDGWYALYDMMGNGGVGRAIIDTIDPYDYQCLCTVVKSTEEAAKAIFEKKHSLSHKVGSAIDTVLIEPSLVHTLDGARNINSSLIDMIKEVGASKERSKVEVGSGQFAKKPDV